MIERDPEGYKHLAQSPGAITSSNDVITIKVKRMLSSTDYVQLFSHFFYGLLDSNSEE